MGYYTISLEVGGGLKMNTQYSFLFLVGGVISSGLEQ